jgi:hypothetical protein
VAGVDEHRVGARGEHVVGLVEHGVRVDGGERRVHRLDLAPGELGLEPALEDARRGAAVAVREAGGRRLALEDDAEGAGRLVGAEEVDVRRRDEPAAEVAAREVGVGEHPPRLGLVGHEQRRRAAVAGRPEPELRDDQQQPRRGQREGHEHAPARGRRRVGGRGGGGRRRDGRAARAGGGHGGMERRRRGET